MNFDRAKILHILSQQSFHGVHEIWAPKDQGSPKNRKNLPDQGFLKNGQIYKLCAFEESTKNGQ